MSKICENCCTEMELKKMKVKSSFMRSLYYVCPVCGNKEYKRDWYEKSLKEKTDKKELETRNRNDY